MVSTRRSMGLPLARAEGPDKVTGATQFPADVQFPGTLVGKCLRSPYPYARINSIDTTAAQQLPGVHAVLTAQDIPDCLAGRTLRDLPVLARDKVLFVGQKVVAVAAEDTDLVEEALNLIEVEYEELTPVMDPVAAMKPDAPVLHPNYESYDGRNQGPRPHPNLVGHGFFSRATSRKDLRRPTAFSNIPSGPIISTRVTLSPTRRSSIRMSEAGFKYGATARLRSASGVTSLTPSTCPNRTSELIRWPSAVTSAARAVTWMSPSPAYWRKPPGAR